jgi:hypothetical protein
MSVLQLIIKTTFCFYKIKERAKRLNVLPLNNITIIGPIWPRFPRTFLVHIKQFKHKKQVSRP